MKKKLALLLCLAIILSNIAGCSGEISSQKTQKDNQANSKYRNSLIIGTDSEVNNLNLQDQQDQINNVVLKNTHQTLIYFNNGLNGPDRFNPCLAKSWEFIDDRHIRMKLRDDVHFNDDQKTKMTAEDVKFTLDMAMKNKTKNNLVGFLSCKIIDPYTIEIEIDKYNNEFIQTLSTVPLGIQSKKAYQSNMKHPYYIGTGPYKIDDIREGEYCRLKKVDDYWGNNVNDVENLKPGVSEIIEFRPYFDSSSRAAALQSKEIDVCINPPIKELNLLEENKDIKIYEEPGTKLIYFGFNVSKEPWNNQKLRQAVACAIDRKTVLQAGSYGKGMLQTTILNRGLWSFYDEMLGFDYNIDRAREFMKESGYKDKNIKTTLIYPSVDPYEKIANVIQKNLKEINIDVKLEPAENSRLKEECSKGNQDLFLWRWNEDSKVDFVYRDLFYTGSSSNYFHYSDAKADNLIDSIATDKDKSKRRKSSKYLQSYLVFDCPEVPLYISNLVIAYNKNLKGACFYSGGNHDWSHAYIEEE